MLGGGGEGFSRFVFDETHFSMQNRFVLVFRKSYLSCKTLAKLYQKCMNHADI